MVANYADGQAGAAKWKDPDLAQGHLVVSAGNAKTDSRHVVPDAVNLPLSRRNDLTNRPARKIATHHREPLGADLKRLR